MCALYPDPRRGEILTLKFNLVTNQAGVVLLENWLLASLHGHQCSFHASLGRLWEAEALLHTSLEWGRLCYHRGVVLQLKCLLLSL